MTDHTNKDLPPLPQGYRKIPTDYQGDVYLESQMRAYARATLSAGASADKAIPMKEISNLVAWGMDEVVKNGANSISMPDDLVAVAYFIAHPHEFALSAPADILRMRQQLEQEWCELQKLKASYASAPAAPMVDMVPPATSRDRWMYEQGRLAERDPRTPGSLAAQVANAPAAGSGPEGLLPDVLIELRHARKFVSSRERIAAVGLELFDAVIERVEAAVSGKKEWRAFTRCNRCGETNEVAIQQSAPQEVK